MKLETSIKMIKWFGIFFLNEAWFVREEKGDEAMIY